MHWSIGKLRARSDSDEAGNLRKVFIATEELVTDINEAPRLKPGEEWGDFIGCYLLWVCEDDVENHYYSRATTREDLLLDAIRYFEGVKNDLLAALASPEAVPPHMSAQQADLFTLEIKRRSRDKLELVNDMLENMEKRVVRHLARDTDDPFFLMPGVEVFLSMGVRTRDDAKPALTPGQADGDSIGCYLLYVRPEPGDAPSYQSVASDKAGLLEDCRDLLERLRAMQIAAAGKPHELPPGMPAMLAEASAADFRRRHEADLHKVDDLLANLDERVEQHLAGDMTRSLLALPGLEILLNTGVRARSKRQGNYTE